MPISQGAPDCFNEASEAVEQGAMRSEGSGQAVWTRLLGRDPGMQSVATQEEETAVTALE